MAITGIMRPGFIQLRVLDMSASLEHYCKRIGLHVVSTEPDGRVYLKTADEFDHHSIVLRQAATAGMDCMAFKVAAESDLDAFAARITARGHKVDDIAAGEQPGIGRRIGFTVPAGHRIELFHHADQSEPKPAIRNPDIWNSEPHGMKPIRFDHALLYGPDIEGTLKFFEDVLDFRCAERIDTPDGLLAIWMTCSNKAHDIAFVNHHEPAKFHHVAFELENWQHIGEAADIMARYDISIDVGPTRHGITRGQTIYFFDPSGNRNEVFAGGYNYYPDHPTRCWDETEIGRGIFYYEGVLNEAFLAVVT